MRRLMVALLLGGVAGLVAVACSDAETGDGTGCTPGEEIFCRCKGGVEATKTCLDDGQSFAECSTIDGPCPEGEEDGDDDDDDGSDICTPGEATFCSCPGGDEGQKTCDETGDFFGDCATADGPCEDATSSTATSTSSVSSSSSGGGGTTLLFEPCGDAGECASGTCLMGFCTLECGNFGECIDEGGVQGDCARFEGGTVQLCAPYCDVQGDCIDPYGEQSRCGYAVALDNPGEGFLACGDWGADLETPPLGSECIEDVECHLNLYGAQRVCYFDECIEGCYVADDCPESAPECSSGGATPGTCG